MFILILLMFIHSVLVVIQYDFSLERILFVVDNHRHIDCPFVDTNFSIVSTMIYAWLFQPFNFLQEPLVFLDESGPSVVPAASGNGFQNSTKFSSRTQK